METSILAIIFFGVLTIIMVICTVVLYPALRDVVDELKKILKDK